MLKNNTIVIDLDGTLLNSEKKINDLDLKKLKEISQYNKIIIASGRSYNETNNIIQKYDLKDYIVEFVVCSNGELIYNIKNGEIIKSDFINNDLAISIIQTLEYYGMYWYVVSDGSVFCKDIKYNCKKYLENKRYNINVIEHIEELKQMKIEKFIINNDLDIKISEIKEILYNEYDIEFFIINRKKTYKNETYMQNNILPKGINKYSATRFIVTELKLPKNLIAVGDGINDYDLLKNADFAICMSNSCKEIKEISNFITKSNDSNGVSYAIEKIENF